MPLRNTLQVFCSDADVAVTVSSTPCISNLSFHLQYAPSVHHQLKRRDSTSGTTGRDSALVTNVKMVDFSGVVRLHPAPADYAFWQSQLAYSTWQSIDRFGTINAVFTNFASTVLQLRRTNTANLTLWILHLSCLSLLALQLWNLHRRPQTYQRQRPWIIWSSRILRIAIMFMAQWDVAYKASLENIAASGPAEAQQQRWRDLAYLVAAFSYIGLLNCINFPLPLKGQAFMAIIMGLVGVFVHARLVSVADALRSPSQHLGATCAADEPALLARRSTVRCTIPRRSCSSSRSCSARPPWGRSCT